MINGALQFSHAARMINPSSGSPLRASNRPSCVETYGITLDSSEYYVHEWAAGMPAPKANGTPELSTVLRGMARNGCGENLTNVRISFTVHDEAGRKGDGFYLIESMAVGEVRPFERAWMGRVNSYEVTADQ